ncbi:hypothetical protein V1634_29745 [Plantactinospora veratri]|uniref:Uncharacterized protein n=1 Tax=Plantactinospora veratri TaxID=1436122 RepID=A0ABU7SM40_9ACTN
MTAPTTDTTPTTEATTEPATDPIAEATTEPATDPIAEQSHEPAQAVPLADQTPAEAATSALVVDTPNVEAAEGASDATDRTDVDQADEQGTPDEVNDEDDGEETTDNAPSLLAAACAAGTVRLFRLRGNGTTRRLMWLTGEALEVAEWYRLRLDQGASVRQIAEECQTSRPTVRRALGVLDLMDAIEAGEHDDLYADGVTEVLFASDEDGEE